MKTRDLQTHMISVMETLINFGVYPYKYMDSWKRCNETPFPENGGFYT